MIALLTLASAASASPHADIAAVLTAFADEVARADADAASARLHPAYVEVVRLPDQELVLSAEAYVGGIRGGTIGGKPIALTIDGIDVRGEVATATTTRVTGALVLVSATTLVHDADTWRLTSAATQAGTAP